MKIIDMKVTDGPNYWSVQRKRLVVMTLDLQEMENHPTHKIPGFYERLKQFLPSLEGHRCSEGIPGGFFIRVERGTWLGHVIEHIALEIQTLAGIETGFGRTRDAGKKGLYHVVFSCAEPVSGRYAGEAAVRIAECLADGFSCDLDSEIKAIQSLYAKNKLGPSTQAIVDAAEARNIPVLRLNNDSLVQLGYGAARHRIEAAVADTTSNIAVELACDKEATKRLLRCNAIPVPQGQIAETCDDVNRIIEEIGYPVVVKPVDGNHGRGVTINICDLDTAISSYEIARKYSNRVIIEKFIGGFDFRVLVVNYKVVAAALRTPPFVTGNGSSTLAELVEILNSDPQRGEGHENILTKVVIDNTTEQCLQPKGIDATTVVAAGETIFLKQVANLSNGGTATDVTDSVHAGNIALFERIARIIGLDICGIDVVAPDLNAPLAENGGVVLEVNAGPGLRMHLFPYAGKPRDVAEPIIDMLFPGDSNGRIPIIAITGTNGKTTTTRLIAHIMREAGYRTGYTTTDGIYAGNTLIEKGDCTGPLSARVILQDPTVDCAVLECARGGILRGGLGFDECDVAVITNIAEDHLGLQGIDSIEKLSRVKAVVAESVSPQGHAVLNADDDKVYRLREQLLCGVILFSMKAGSDRIGKHVQQGGTAVVYENGWLTIISGGIKTILGRAEDLPITFFGRATFNVANALAAAGAAFAQGIAPALIFQALQSFIPSYETLPGRMNIFEYNNSKIIVDYAHNTHGLQAVSSFLKSFPASKRVGVIAGVGDRRDKDIVSFGREAAGIFDEIIIRQDADLRGRTAENLIRLLSTGIREVSALIPITIIPDEFKALDMVLKQTQDEIVIVFFADNIELVVKRLRVAAQRTNAITDAHDNSDQPSHVAA